MMDDFRFVKCPICGWEKNPRMSCFNCGGKAPASSKASSDTAIAASEARIAELERWQQSQRDATAIDAVDAAEMQDRIAALEKALEQFAREEVDSMYKDPWHLQFSDPDGFVDFTDFTIGDLRRAAALLKEKE